MTRTANSPKSPIRRKGILNRITDRWWLILTLWLVVCVPLLYLIRAFVVPTYEAVSLLQVQPVEHGLYGNADSEAVDYDRVTPYLQTQVALITTDRVLTNALSSPEIKNLNFIKQSDDPRADLRARLLVEIVPNAYMIRVALALPNGKEAAAIVNAVVNSYRAYNGEFKRAENSKLRISLAVQREKIQHEIKMKREELNTLARKTYGAQSSVIPLNESGKQSDPTQPTFGSVTEELRDWIAGEMVKIDVDLIKAQANLEVAQSANQGANDQQYRQSLAELKLSVAVLQRQKESLAKYYSQLKIDTNTAEDDTIQAKLFLNHQLEVLLKAEDHLKTNLEELDFKASQEDVRVALVDDAKAPKVPTNNDRLKYQVAAPIVVLLMLLGLCLLTPITDEPLDDASAKPTPQDEIGH